uniref:Uncharacterized protein n=1 Tax=Acrobeloides nanus TaxID=290746 RepID=A0A914C4L1_9BILA
MLQLINNLKTGNVTSEDEALEKIVIMHKKMVWALHLPGSSVDERNQNLMPRDISSIIQGRRSEAIAFTKNIVEKVSCNLNQKLKKKKQEKKLFTQRISFNDRIPTIEESSKLKILTFEIEKLINEQNIELFLNKPDPAVELNNGDYFRRFQNTIGIMDKYPIEDHIKSIKNYITDKSTKEHRFITGTSYSPSEYCIYRIENIKYNAYIPEDHLDVIKDLEEVPEILETFFTKNIPNNLQDMPYLHSETEKKISYLQEKMEKVDFRKISGYLFF